MKTLSLKLENNIFLETEEILKLVGKKRNRYINEALNHFNRIQKRKHIYSKLQTESGLVKDESLLVLKEFENIDYES
jgi:hypothetical protein